MVASCHDMSTPISLISRLSRVVGRLCLLFMSTSILLMIIITTWNLGLFDI